MKKLKARQSAQRERRRLQVASWAPSPELRAVIDKAQQRMNETFREVDLLKSRVFLPFHRKAFELDGNPFDAWEAYRIARQAKEPLPIWVLEYLDDAAARLFAGEEAADALGMSADRGETPALKAFNGRRWVYYGSCVGLCIREGDKETHAIAWTAHEFGVSESTVRRAWQAYKATMT